MTLPIVFTFILAYLIGGIPNAVWIGKVFWGKDVRTEGSGNAGATNTFRVLGTTAGIMVLALDILKGVTAVLLANISGRENFSPSQFLYYQITLGLTAGLGHIFPVYLRFKGGKGVATFFGVVLYLFPLAAGICVITFLAVFIITHYVSLGSILASVAFTISIFVWYFKSNSEVPLGIFAVLVPVIISYTHRQNFKRILNGTESKMYFFKKQNPS
jgi:glycerol-3-phosphate acyltransferase PlsY